MRANDEREADTTTDTATDIATDTATTDGPAQCDRDRESEREKGGVRRAAAGRPALTPGIKPATQVATARRNWASGGRRLVCDGARYKGEETAVSVFLPVCHGGLFKCAPLRFFVFLDASRQGSSSCGDFYAKMRGTQRTVKSALPKPALAQIYLP